jgi:hypothetical protein
MRFTEEQREEILAYLNDEVGFALIEQEGRRKKWDRWRRQRMALPESEVKNYPFKKASNVVPPVALVNTNNVYAGLNNMFGAIHPFWTVGAQRIDDPDDLETAKISTRYLDVLAQGKADLNKKKVSKTVHYETASLGLNVVKVAWTERSWSITEEDDSGNILDTSVVLHRGPEIIPIPAEDFLYREAYQDIQTMPWCAHVLHKTWPEIKQMEELGYYENVDQIEDFYRQVPEEGEKAQQQREGVESMPTDIWDIHEFYLFWEVDGRVRDYIITVHLESEVILRSSYNEMGTRCLEGFGYLINPFRLEGVGVGHLSDHMQEECTMIHNARIDGIHIGVAPMFKARRNSGVQQGELVFPGKVWMLDDPMRDLDVIKAPEPYNMSLMTENQAFAYARQAVGQPEDIGGFANSTAKTRDTSGMVRQRLSQSGSVFASVTEGIEDSWTRVGELVWLQLVHHRTEVIQNEIDIGRLSPTEIQTLDKALSIPKDQVPIRLKFSVRTSDVEQTFETKRQNLLTRTQLSAMFFEQTMPVVQMLFGPQGMQIQAQAPELFKYLARIYTARCRMMEEAIRFFGEDDTGKYVPDYKRLEALLDFQKMLQDNQAAMGGLVNVGTGNGSGSPQPAIAASFGDAGAAGGPGAGSPPAQEAGGGQGTGGASAEPGMGSF